MQRLRGPDAGSQPGGNGSRDVGDQERGRDEDGDRERRQQGRWHDAELVGDQPPDPAAGADAEGTP